MISLDSRKHYLSITKYKNKNLELKINKNILIERSSILQQKKRLLRDKYEQLNDVNYRVWNTEDKFCNEIWNFSLKHNFVFFNQYPNIIESIKPHKCKYSSIFQKDVQKINVDKEATLSNLKQEINAINSELKFVSNKSIQQNIEDYKCALNNVKLFAEEVMEVIRLLNSSENFMNIPNTPLRQLSNRCINKAFVSAKKLFKNPIFDIGISIGNKVTAISSTIIQNPKLDLKDNNIITFGKFIMKKQSVISLKYQQSLKN
ncbi:uncharacterized protein LOC143264866 [Megachile rotundata]|uniref:uncharacterized protein LOC143264866 n=1 Tax=Megachile rotundata TaxID=143995 RepID=UPI003FD3A313